MSMSRVALVGAASTLVLAVALNASQATKSVNDGVYSADQAARGDAAFKSKCSGCHYISQFSGDDLYKEWAGKPLSELFSLMRETMPEDNPGTLDAQTYADVIAYFLQVNKFPAASTDLVGTDEVMRGIMMEKPK